MLKSTCCKVSVAFGLYGIGSYLLYNSKYTVLRSELDKLIRDHHAEIKKLRTYNHLSPLKTCDIRTYFPKDDKFVNGINFSNCSPYFTRYFSRKYHLNIIHETNNPPAHYRKNYVGYSCEFNEMSRKEYKDKVIYDDYDSMYADSNEDEKKLLYYLDNKIRSSNVVFLYIHKDDIAKFSLINSAEINLKDLTKNKIRFFIEYEESHSKYSR